MVRFLIGFIDYSLTRPLFIAHLRSRGVHWSYWVIDTPEDFTKAFNLGVDAVMTDSPAMLAAWLDVNRPTWRSACTYSQEPKYASGTTATPSIAGINTAETRDVAITT